MIQNKNCSNKKTQVFQKLLYRQVANKQLNIGVNCKKIMRDCALCYKHRFCVWTAPQMVVGFFVVFVVLVELGNEPKARQVIYHWAMCPAPQMALMEDYKSLVKEATLSTKTHWATT
jgi:hypothetical protein